MRECSSRAVRALALGLTLPVVSASAQAVVGHSEDATLAPRGVLRLRALSAWTRYDARFSTAGTAPLGAMLTADSLGVAQAPVLDTVQRLIASASANPFTLSLGRSRLDATAREEILPIMFEYGVSRRISVQVTVPIVRRRVASLFRLDTAGAFVNVGVNPNGVSATATQTNTNVQTEFANAIAQLQQRITTCSQNPGAAGCAAFNARAAEARQLLQTSQSLRNQFGALYGSSTSAGSAFVPLAGSSAQTAIASRITTLNAQYQSLLASSSTYLQTTPAAASAPAGTNDFLTAFRGPRRDSIGTTENVGIGDVEIGVKALVLDRPRSASRSVGLQLALEEVVHLPTGSPHSPSAIVDLGFGGEGAALDSRAFLDARAGRFGLLAAGTFVQVIPQEDLLLPFPTPDVQTVYRRPHRYSELSLSPRWHFSEPFSVHGAYSMRGTDRQGNDQLVGGGVSFSTLSSYHGSGPLPIEMRFTHLEAISGDPGRPKFFRDQLELKLYFRLR